MCKNSWTLVIANTSLVLIVKEPLLLTHDLDPWAFIFSLAGFRLLYYLWYHNTFTYLQPLASDLAAVENMLLDLLLLKNPLNSCQGTMSTARQFILRLLLGL